MKSAKKVRKKNDLSIRVKKKASKESIDDVAVKKKKKSAKSVAQRVAETQVKASKPKKPHVEQSEKELTTNEYQNFRRVASKKEKVRPEELVTLDRRKNEKTASFEEPPKPKERRQKVQRRRQIDPTTCERDYSLDEIEFMNALDEYKRTSGRMFPTCSEILEVFRGLGYTKDQHEESVEVSSNPQTGDIFITSTEINTMSRPTTGSTPFFCNNGD